MRATFSIDEETKSALQRVAEQLGESKSAIVRKAVLEFEARRDRLTERERLEKLAIIAKIKVMPFSGSDEAAEKELAELREDRRIARPDP